MSVFVLKIIAVITMFIDHLGVEFQGVNDPVFLQLGNSMRIIGRIAFPIYAFLIAEGCKHTGNIKKYILRLFIFGVISEIPFDMFLSSAELMSSGESLNFFNIANQNVFFTLGLGALAVFCYESIKKTNVVLGVLPVVLIAGLAEIIHTDYGFVGIITIFAAYVFSSKYLRVLGVLAGMFYLYVISFGFSTSGFIYFAAAAVSCIFLLMYNGERGSKLKMVFYVFYPAHLLALALIFYFLK